jgi:hypothetical protein
MLVGEQFDRFAAPIEGRLRREEIEELSASAGLEDGVILPGLGWRVLARAPLNRSG